MFAERRNSPSRGLPSTSSRTVWFRFPCATAAIAPVTSVVGRSRSSTRVLTETSISPQAPLRVRKWIRSRVRPSFPTAWPTRFNSRAICSFAATMSLKVSAIFPGKPVHDPGSRAEKSPCCICCKLARMALKSAAVGSGTSVPRPLLGVGVSCRLVVAADPAGLVGLVRFIIQGSGDRLAQRLVAARG